MGESKIVINNYMKLFELAPIFHWSPSSTDARSTASIKFDGHEYTLSLRCNLSVPDHLRGWLDKIIDNEKNVDSGRYVELINKDNHESFIGVGDIIKQVATEIKTKSAAQHLKYVYMFSATVAQQSLFKKLSNKIAEASGWSVYQDRNYFIIHKPSLKIHQVD
jgi:hypothetical protein